MDMMKKINNLPNNIKKSIADQIKLLSWAVGGINGYFRHSIGDIYGVIFIIISWGFLQFFAHYLLFDTNNENGQKE